MGNDCLEPVEKNMKRYKVTIRWSGDNEETTYFDTKEEAIDYFNDVISPYSNITGYIEEVEQ